MSVLSVLTLLGGLSFFLFGMKIMGGGLEKISGGRLEKTLEKLTSGIIKGVLLGTLVTAVIQSSTVTTVMVIGFVNSGIMTLQQSVGVIMGANLGTTITAWILSLTGIEGNNLLINLLKPSSFAPALAFIGIILLMTAKKQKRKDIGTMLLGFALLMNGMQMMSSAVSPLAEEEWFGNIFLVISKNPILGVIVGAVLTAIVQSSSASVGILQAFSATGAITVSGATPIILGQNIGACVTVLISCIGANKNAKRAAFIRLYFNIIGVILFSAVFYGLDAFLHFDFFTQRIGAVGIAIVHTGFNIFATVVLLPFSKLLIKLAKMTIRESRNERDSTPFLDERFLNTPAVAVDRCTELTNDMMLLTRDTIFRSFDCLEKYDSELEEVIIEGERRADIYEDVLGSYLVKLSAKDLTQRDSREVARLLHSIGDLERISDHAVSILNVSKEIHDKKIAFSEMAKREIQVLIDATREIVDITVDTVMNFDLIHARDVEPLEQVIDDIKAKMKKRHIKRLQQGECTIELGFIFSDLLSNVERVSDLCSNVAAYMVEVIDERLDTHEYSRELREGNMGYEEKYNEYKSKYSLGNPTLAAELSSVAQVAASRQT